MQIDHCDVSHAVATIRRVLKEDSDLLAATSENDLRAVNSAFKDQSLIDRFCKLTQ